MDAADGLTFRIPVVLWALGAVPLAVWWLLARERSRRSLSDRFVSEVLRGRDRWRSFRPAVLAVALTFAIIAMAGPRLGAQTTKTVQRESNTIIALDTSLSMAASDVGTSRLEAAKAIARQLIDRNNGRVGLVAFEGAAQVVSPLTDDHEAVETLLDSLQPGDLDEPGSDLAAAVRDAVSLAATAGRESASIIIISDGEEQGASASDAIAQATKAHVPISCVLVGSSDGAAIPTGPGETLQDENGAQVVTRASAEPMTTIAHQTGGQFVTNPFSAAAIDSIASQLERPGALKDLTVRQPIERYQWPLTIAVAALILALFLDRGLL